MSGSSTPTQLTSGRFSWQSSQYNGVSWFAELGAWKVEILVGEELRWIGCYPGEVEAAIAYDDALSRIRQMDPLLHVADFNFGDPRDAATQERRDVAKAYERGAQIASSSSSAAQTQEGVQTQTASSAPRKRAASGESSASDDEKRRRFIDEGRARATDEEEGTTGAQVPTQAAAREPQLGALPVQSSTLPLPPRSFLPRYPAYERIDLRPRIINEIYNMGWLQFDQQPLPRETRDRGIFKLKFSIFGLSWAFAFRAQLNYDYPVFLPEFDNNLAKVKVMSLVRAFGNANPTGQSAVNLPALLQNIASTNLMPYHPQIFYAYEFIIDSRFFGPAIPLRQLSPRPPLGPQIIPTSPRASPEIAPSTQQNASHATNSATASTDEHVALNPRLLTFLNTMNVSASVHSVQQDRNEPENPEPPNGRRPSPDT